MKSLRETLNKPQNRIAMVIFFSLWFCTAYFARAASNGNSISRMAVAYSVVDGDGFAIDPYQHSTIDKARFDGKYYSDKAPGMSLIAIPAVWAAEVIVNILEPPPGQLKDRLFEAGELRPLHGFFTMMAVSSTSAPLSALAVTVVFLLTFRALGDPGSALFAAVGFGLGTIAWGWATTMFGHAAAGALLLLGFAVFWWIDHNPAGRFDAPWGAIGGALLGWTVVTEFPAGPVAGAIAVLALVRSFSWTANRRIRVIGSAFVGGIAALAPLLLYNWTAFGSPLKVGYSEVVGFEGMEAGFFGLTAPTLEALYGITFSAYRGLFWFSPILLAAPFGIYRMWTRPRERPYAIIVLITFGHFLILTASYHYWNGGFSTGPRHVVPSIALTCVPLAFLWADAGPRLRKWLLGLLGMSAAIAFVCISTIMTIEDGLRNPLFNRLLPDLIEGRVQTIFALVSIKNHLCLAPPILVLAAGAMLVRKEYFRVPGNHIVDSAI